MPVTTLHETFDPPAPCTTCGKTHVPKGCLSCGTLDDLRQVTVGSPGAQRLVCLGCLERACRSLGDGLPDLHVRRCVACPRRGRHPGEPDPPQFAVVFIWPPHSFATGPHWPVCGRHLAEALRATRAPVSPHHRERTRV